MKYLALFIVPLLFLAACGTQDYSDNVLNVNELDVIEQESGSYGQVIATNFYRYNKEGYEKAKTEGKAIFLESYATWCPICKAEAPNIMAAFNEFNNDKVIGFRIHFNDNEVNDEDLEISKEFGITYQHTKIILDKTGNEVLKTLEVFDKERTLEEFNKVI